MFPDQETIRVAVVVAHPDDESLWAGGLILNHPEWSLRIVTLCRGLDPDRAPRFAKALQRLGATGAMGDLDDGPDQAPLDPCAVREAILTLLPVPDYDLVITHGPQGEYTRHLRHEEVACAVRNLWQDRVLRGRLWQFAYEDGAGAHVPRPREDAHFRLPLPDALWARKLALITEVYGFAPTSWEAQAAPRTEAFRCFESGSSA